MQQRDMPISIVLLHTSEWEGEGGRLVCVCVMHGVCSRRQCLRADVRSDVTYPTPPPAKSSRFDAEISALAINSRVGRERNKKRNLTRVLDDLLTQPATTTRHIAIECTPPRLAVERPACFPVACVCRLSDARDLRCN